MASSHRKRPLWRKFARGELRRTIRIVLKDPWFLRIAVVCMAGIVALALFVPKIWNTAPPWHKTPMKISGLDVVQSWSLRRAAEARAREGKLQESMAAWRGAILNTPADTEVYRGMLKTLIDSKERRREYIPFAVGEGRALLELSRTNNADLELMASFFRRFELFDWELAMLRGATGHMTAAGNRLLAEALFFSGDAERFKTVWDQNTADFSNDSRLALVHTAWAAAWGPPGGLLPARRALAEACKDPQMGSYADKLQLQVSYNLSDITTYKPTLDRLIDVHEDRAADHVHYWKLLLDSGRGAEAADLARKYSDTPLTAHEAFQMAAVFDALKLTEYAAEFLAKQLLVFRDDVELWVSRAEMLSKLRRWDELRETSVTMRNERRLARRLTSYSYYVDGVVEYSLGERENAGRAFGKILESPLPSPAMALKAAANLRAMGFADIATQLLKTNESAFSNQKEFWQQLSISAYASRDSELLQRAAKRCYELEPTSAQMINDYAAALIANRTQPDEAVTLTLRLVTLDPDRVGYQINHAMALILNRRMDEAERILNRIDASNLIGLDATLIHYSRFDIAVQRSQQGRAKEEAAKIERQFLLPVELRYIDDSLKAFDSE